jgi:hypothetical protein
MKNKRKRKPRRKSTKKPKKTTKEKNRTKKKKPSTAMLTGQPNIVPMRAEWGSVPLTGGE